jgi:starch-binding outer membrane protein, SusD/RagB family
MNMKKTALYFSLLLCLTISGCKKYLDKEPDNRTQVRTADQIAQLLTTAYPKANYIPFCEAMSDNAEDKAGGSSGLDFLDKINRESFLFQVVEVAPDDVDSPNYYWSECYKAIAAANLALEYISASDDSASLRAHKGEALVARAYAHFMLVTLFSEVYDPDNAATNPGIPYVTEPEKVTFKEYERGTVASVYEAIERDLNEGLPLINDAIYGSAPRFHFNRRAASAFAARFYLFKREWDKVITYSNAALGNSPAENLRDWNTVLTNLQYLELQAEYTKSTTQGNLLLQEANSAWGRSYAQVRFGLGDQVTQELFLRPNVTGNFYAYDVYGANPQFYNIPKFYEHFVRETINANSGQPYNTIPLITGEEVLLNRAEAYLRLNNTTAALNDLNTFASRNIDEYNPSSDRVTTAKCSNYYGTSSQNGVFLAILDFKRAFFMHEGMRWFDILRLRIPVTHITQQGDIIQIAGNDPRRVLQLPELTIQAGLEQNPR